MSFITWWFDAHWCWATLITPGFSFLYAIYTESTGWAWACAIWWLVLHGALRSHD